MPDAKALYRDATNIGAFIKEFGYGSEFFAYRRIEYFGILGAQSIPAGDVDYFLYCQFEIS